MVRSVARELFGVWHAPEALWELRREESEARLVSGAEAVRLRGFSTRVHRVETLVAYKADDAKA